MPYLFDISGKENTLDLLIPSWKLNTEEFLNIAISLSKELESIHEKGTVVKNITPEKIIINKDYFSLTISLFPEFDNTKILDDSRSLFYLSPELTGRFDFPIDHRSDLFSLGVIFHELITGTLPFNSNDDLVEYFYSQTSLKVSDKFLNSEDIPEMVSRIVSKLLTPVPSERYYSASSLRTDLEFCQKTWDDTGTIPLFEPDASNNLPQPFLVGNIIGRDQEINSIEKYFFDSSGQNTNLFLISGTSGIGKTSLVNEFSKKHKNFIFKTGKFEKNSKSLPYHALKIVFNSLVNHLLQKDEFFLKKWKDDCIQVLGPNLNILTDFIPQMEIIVGKHKNKSSEVSPLESHNRFHSTLINFLQLFTNSTETLLLFLDDVQWADQASVNLLKQILIHDNKLKLHMICAFRSDEIDDNQHFNPFIEEYTAQIGKPGHLYLSALSLQSIRKWIIDTIDLSPSSLELLIRDLDKRCGGNPLKIKEYYDLLVIEKLFEYNEKDKLWYLLSETRSDVNSDFFTQSVIQKKINSYSPGILKILNTANCIGTDFQVESISAITGLLQADIIRDIDTLINDRIVISVNNEYSSHRSYNDKKLFSSSQLTRELSYRFLHDSTREQLADICPPDEKINIHEKICRYIKNLENPDELIFELVYHESFCRNNRISVDKNMELTKLYIKASQKALTSHAYYQALNYIKVAEKIYFESGIHIPERLLEIKLLLMECEYLCLNIKTADAISNELFLLAENPIQKSLILNKKLLFYILLQKNEEAIKIGRKALETLGISLPAGKLLIRFQILKLFLNTKKYFLSKDHSHLLEINTLSDSNYQVALTILGNMINPAYFFNQELFILCSLLIVNISVRFGNNKGSAHGYLLFAMISGSMFGNYDKARKIGEVALKIATKYQDYEIFGRLYVVFAAAICQWVSPLRDTLQYYKDGYKIAKDYGDYTYAGIILNTHLSIQLRTGRPLNEIYDEFSSYSSFMNSLNSHKETLEFNMYLEAMDWFRGKSIPDEQKESNYSCKNGNTKLCYVYYQVFLAQYYYLSGENKKAFNHIDNAAREAFWIKTTPLESELFFLRALIIAENYQSFNSIQKIYYKRTLTNLKNCFKKWADACKENSQHRHWIVKGLIAKLEFNYDDAEMLFKKAVVDAEKNKFILIEAIANEHLFKLMLLKNESRNLFRFLEQSYALYLKWGAIVKANIMENQYGHLITTNNSFPLANNKTIPLTLKSAFDISAVIKFSQNISEEISLSNLINTFLNVSMKYSSARKGVFVIKENNNWVVKTEINNDLNEKINMESIPLDQHSSLPYGLIHHVINTGKIISNRDKQNIDVVGKGSTASWLCLPVIKSKSIIGILYLENDTLPYNFSDQSIETLRHLASQAAISIENARLYESIITLNKDLEKANIELKKEVIERTKSEEMLRKSERQLIERNRDLDTFIYKASHDLKGPLSSVIGLTNVARLDIRESKALEYFELISKNTQRLDNILHDLIDLTRVTKGSLQYQPVLFNELISKILDTLQHLPGYGDMKFRVFVDNSTPFHSDSKMLTSVFQNLIENAVKYRRMDDMGSFLDIRIKRQSNGVIIELEDNGLGIPEEVQKKVFDMFFRAHKHSKGSGLGLYIVKTAIEKLGGTISLSSIENKGSTFVLFLPHRTSNPILEQ